MSLTLAAGNLRLTLAPELGAAWSRLELQHNGESVPLLIPLPEDPASYARWYQGAQMFPWPNRLGDGRHVMEGRVFQAEINEPARNTAIHGLVAALPFQLEGVREEDHRAEAILRLDFPGQAGFPWRCQIRNRFQLHTGSLTVETEILHRGPLPEAAGLPMPVGQGWHPYFCLPGALAEWELRLPELMLLPTDPERLLPMGASVPYSDFREFAAIGDYFFESSFALAGNALKGPQATTCLRTPDGRLTLEVWQETSAETGYRYLQLFTPPGRESLAIEPMTCAPDAFNNRMGLLSLAPGEALRLRCGLRVNIQ